MIDEPSDMADEIVDSVENNDEEDGLTARERSIEHSKEEERILKAKELRRQLRKRELGILKYRWPMAILVLSGLMAIWTQFLQVMVRPPDIGFDSYLTAFIEYGNLFFLTPTIAGVIMIIIGIVSYQDSRGPYLSVIPSMLMIIAGAMIYYLVSFALAFDPEAAIAATGTPLSMIVIGVTALFSIGMRERE
jgi:hypothetical protein